LYFGNQRILLLDQGFTQLHTDWELRGVVDDCIEKWCSRNGRKVEDMQLLLAFSHLHADHFAAINQFVDRPNTRYMGLTHEEMVGFWGMTKYPEERVTLDLGGRDILIWGSPGHVISEFAY
jgi:glyoxylase-like metal-dependent hydrolase (beta-lactamase superfamily II)